MTDSLHIAADEDHADKDDRKDAQGIAELMRLGWFRPVHCKTKPIKACTALKAWAMRIAKRAGMNKAKVALKLAVTDPSPCSLDMIEARQGSIRGDKPCASILI